MLARGFQNKQSWLEHPRKVCNLFCTLIEVFLNHIFSDDAGIISCSSRYVLWVWCLWEHNCKINCLLYDGYGLLPTRGLWWWDWDDVNWVGLLSKYKRVNNHSFCQPYHSCKVTYGWQLFRSERRVFTTWFRLTFTPIPLKNGWLTVSLILKGAKLTPLCERVKFPLFTFREYLKDIHTNLKLFHDVWTLPNNCLFN